MSEVWNKEFKRKSDKFNEWRVKFSGISDVAQLRGIELAELKVGRDKEKVSELAKAWVRKYIRGNITPEVYCAAVAAICDELGVPCVARCGLAMPVGADNVEKTGERKYVPNAVVLGAEGVIYTIFGGRTDIELREIDTEII